MAAPRFSFSDDPAALAAAKRAARAAALRARGGQDAAAAGMALGAHVLRGAPPPPGAVVSGFWPLAGEIDIRPLLYALRLRGHPVALPITPSKGEALSFRLWEPGQAMVRERFGTMAPTGGAAEPSYLLVPLLAFDGACRRLGYGAGYYDRTLAALPGATAVGVAFAAQRVDRVPTGPYDIPLHAVATERGVIRPEPV